MSEPNKLREELLHLPISVLKSANSTDRYLASESIDAFLDAVIKALPETRKLLSLRDEYSAGWNDNSRKVVHLLQAAKDGKTT